MSNNLWQISKLIIISALTLNLYGCDPLPQAETPPIITPEIFQDPAKNQTNVPTPSPTQEVLAPSAPNGLRPVNAASETYENGNWVVRNAEGQVTAIWNHDTETWDYMTENIQVEYTQIGLEIDQSLIEPFLGPLPPDDPSTHFIDLAKGQRVTYGIGPETSIDTTAGITYPAREVFARFRGITSILPGEPLFRAVVLEIPRTVDKSDIFIVRVFWQDFTVRASINDSSVYDQYSMRTFGIERSKMVQLANDQLVGQMVMMFVMLKQKDPEAQQISNTVLNYLSGISEEIPRYTVSQNSQAIQSHFMAPESQYFIH